MSSETNKRLQAKLEGFSEITALTQRAINAAMVKLVTDKPEVARVNCKTKRGDSIKATINRPQAALKVTGSSRADIEYFAHFGSGTLHFNYDPPLDFDMKDWVVAFNVKIDSIEVKSGSDEDRQVRGAIQQPGDFSIKSLFLTFNSGDIINPNMDHCNFKGADLDKDDILTLGGLLAKWYIEEGPMVDRRNRTIGYGVHTPDPSSMNEQAPTFPPTSLKFQTYEYIAPGKTAPEEGIPQGDNNMLLYLQMTENKPFPSAAILNYSGNYAASGMDGTMAIEREIFLDKYLLRTKTPELLHVFNHATYVWIKSASVDKPTEVNWEIGVGDSIHSYKPEFFRWEPTGTMSWAWGLPQKTIEQYYKNEYQPGYRYGRLTVDCTTSNHMSTRPGSNVIDVSGKSDIKVEGSAGSSSPWTPWAAKYGVHVWLEWKTTITIKAVDTGGLRIDLDLDESNFKTNSDPIYFKGDEAYGITRESVEKRQSKVVDDLKATLKSSPFKEIKEKLQDNLNSTARFVVPGLGTFRYKDPVFNDKGDLFIQVAYQ
ncbi:hypothetical protein ASPWEDRAFT_45751 [Aspergillus wentii DTO 134E9]|uniref:Uncharacterized protein n=1 Tax=Aspergillus wentii DTO 134E9 TaxID=1073089 RepID=A0A1L9R5N4_ASPWE|nr:uncharacterized protein ASPWEDRAFT_45751 [Aspergillus wentii DTO 134E9]KAI9925305.1 hypothetical protein MW887_006232 [Aspergillus wentii]OJJ30197.1 hypothetical protein ASPWEDRAFT_45751 [Aspergillus wentii DTO 134E9]